MSVRLDPSEWSKIERYRGHHSKRYQETGVTLSFVLKSSSTFHSDGKLNAVGTQLNSIDKIPKSIAPKIDTLYLSNNNLLCLKGVEQFNNVKNLSCANNLIRYLGELRALSQLPRLEKLVCEGNVVTSMPFYREYLLELCPRLVRLDGKAVTALDRSRSQEISGLAQSFYEQLRLNELRNCILGHTHCLILVHYELVSVVLGKYRHLRGDFLPSKRVSSLDPDDKYASATLSIHADGNHVVGTILRVATSGGVFRWLQIACIDFFDEMVQEMAYKGHVLLSRKLIPAHRDALSTDPNALLVHWRRVSEECILHQHQQLMQRIAACERAASKRLPVPVSARFGGDNGKASDIQRSDSIALNVLETVRFHPLQKTSPEFSNYYCGIGHRQCLVDHWEYIRKSTDIQHVRERSVSPGSARSSIANLHERSQEPARRVQKRKPSDGATVVYTHRQSDDDSDDANEPRNQVQDRYDALLRTMRSENVNNSASNNASTAVRSSKQDRNSSTQQRRQSTPISRRLPPQQHDPGSDSDTTPALNRYSTPKSSHRSPSPRKLMSARVTESKASHSILDSSPTDLPIVNFNSDSNSVNSEADTIDRSAINDFIAETLACSGEADSWLNADWIDSLLDYSSLQNGADVVKSKTADAMTDSERMHALGAAARLPLFVRPSSGRSMPTLRTQVDEASLELSERHRLEVRCWNAHHELLANAKSSRATYKGRVDDALGRLAELHNRHKLFRAAVLKARKWVELSSSDIRQIEDFENDVEILKAEAVERQSQVRLLADESADLDIDIINLKTTAEKVRVSSRTLAVEYDNILLGSSKMTAIVAVLRRMFEEKRQSLLNTCLYRLRSNALRSKRVNSFINQRKLSLNRALLGRTFLLWSKVIDVSRRGKKLIAWTKCRVKNTFLHVWRSAYRVETRLRQRNSVIRKYKICNALKMWRGFVLRRQHDSDLEKRRFVFRSFHWLTLTFSAWKRYWTLCRTPSTDFELQGLLKAVQFIKLRVFGSWKNIWLERRTSLRICSNRIIKHQSRLLQQRCLVSWATYYHAASHSRRVQKTSALNKWRYSYYERLLRRESISIAKQRRRKRLLVRSLMWMRTFAARARRHRRAYDRVRLILSYHNIVGTWRNWLSAFEGAFRQREANSVAILHYLGNLARSAFSAWATIVRNTRQEDVYRTRTDETVQTIAQSSSVEEKPRNRRVSKPTKTLVWLENDQNGEATDSDEEGAVVGCARLRTCIRKWLVYARRHHILGCRESMVRERSCRRSLRRWMLDWQGQLFLKWKIRRQNQSRMLATDANELNLKAVQLSTEVAKNRDSALDLKLRVEFVSISVSNLSGELESTNRYIADENASLTALVHDGNALRQQASELKSEMARINNLCGIPSDEGTESDTRGDDFKESSAVAENSARAMLVLKSELMTTVEQVYSQAVSAQTNAARQIEFLRIQKRSADEHLKLAAQSRMQLDDIISQLLQEKERLANELVAMDERLRAAVNELLLATEAHEHQERRLFDDNTSLRSRIEVAQAEENLLRGELKSLHDQWLSRKRKLDQDTTKSFAHSETLSQQLFASAYSSHIQTEADGIRNLVRGFAADVSDQLASSPQFDGVTNVSSASTESKLSRNANNHLDQRLQSHREVTGKENIPNSHSSVRLRKSSEGMSTQLPTKIGRPHSKGRSSTPSSRFSTPPSFSSATATSAETTFEDSVEDVRKTGEVDVTKSIEQLVGRIRNRLKNDLK